MKISPTRRAPSGGCAAVPTGLAVVSTQAKSQHINKRLDLDRLERGGAGRTYVGTDFRRVE